MLFLKGSYRGCCCYFPCFPCAVGSLLVGMLSLYTHGGRLCYSSYSRLRVGLGYMPDADHTGSLVPHSSGPCPTDHRPLPSGQAFHLLTAHSHAKAGQNVCKSPIIGSTQQPGQQLPIYSTVEATASVLGLQTIQGHSYIIQYIHQTKLTRESLFIPVHV